MVGPQINDDFPTIRLDEEDRRSYQNNKKNQTSKNTSTIANDTPTQVKESPWLVFLLWLSTITALATAGGAYYLYDQALKQQQQVQDARARVTELERKLSATDEEMGESTIALQVKVNQLTEKTNELWEQMDKLWASAWRRNQKEIADLDNKVASGEREIKQSISQTKNEVDSQKTALNTLQNNLRSFSDDILALNVQIDQSSQESQRFMNADKKLEEQIAVLEQRNASLISRLQKMEAEIKALSTKVVSSQQRPAAPTSTNPPAQGPGKSQ